MNRAVFVENTVIYGNGNQYSYFMFVEDVIRSNLLAGQMNDAAGKMINIGTGSFVRINRVWEIICQDTGSVIRPDYQPRQIGDILESVANSEKARATLGFKPAYAFEKGIRITLDWYRDQRVNKT